VSRQAGKEIVSDNPILPENLNLCKLFLSLATALPEIAHASLRVQPRQEDLCL